jgi:hypothetical protein
VIPVRVGQQNGCIYRGYRIFQKLVAEQACARAAVQHDALARGRGQLDAGSVAAEVIGAGPGRGDRSPCAPEAQPHAATSSITRVALSPR